MIQVAEVGMASIEEVVGLVVARWQDHRQQTAHQQASQKELA
jgi:hypothetical protein